MPPIRLAVVAATIIWSATLPAAPAEAASGSDPQALVAEAFSGTLADSRRAILVNSYPEVAAVVPDLRNASVSGGSSMTPATIGASAVVASATTRCTAYTGWNSLKSLLGFTIYRFEHQARVCSNGKVVTSHSTPTYEISHVDSTVSSWKIVDRYVKDVGTSLSTSRVQVRVEQCILKYGCYAYTYPTGTIRGSRSNTATIATTLN